MDKQDGQDIGGLRLSILFILFIDVKFEERMN